MRVSKLLGSRSRAAILLAFVPALALMPVRAQPCNAYWLDPTSVPHLEVPVVVASDDSWRLAHAANVDSAALDLIGEANDILRPAGVSLTVVGHVAWASGDGQRTMSGMLDHLDASVPARPGQIVVGLTNRHVSRVDGIAHVGHVHMVARSHPAAPAYDSVVVAHEVGHLLGAGHHVCDHAYRCVMAAKGLELPARWCGHHVVEMHDGAADVLGA